MTLFPGALRSDRPTAMGTPIRPLVGLKNLVTRVLTNRRPFTMRTLSVVTSPADATLQERPEPRLVWTDARTPPAGDFSACAIPNDELDITTVPRRGESWDAVSDFALAYDGYEYWDDLSALAGGILQRWTRRRSLPETLDELRGCLFYEQRRWHHFGEDPSGRSAEYMWAIIDAIGALTMRATSTIGPIPDPRRATAPEAHVKLVATRAVALRSLPSPALTVRALPARPRRLVPVPAAEAHVRLVSAIENSAVEDPAFEDPAFGDCSPGGSDNADAMNAVARHPSGYASRRSWGHASGNPAEHPSMARVVRDLKPMPSADPLPKPPVIERRSRRAGSGAPNRPGGAVNATRKPGNSWPSNGSRWKLEKVGDDATPAPAEVTPLCHEFFDDDGDYRTWVESHPQGFVLHQPRAPRSKAPTLHRAGCAAVAPRDETQARSTGAVRVCGPNPDALTTWSMARGTGQPTACRRCCP